MTAPVITTSMIGKSFAFRSKNPNDAVVYEGRITSICDADDAGRYGNMTQYNQACILADSTIPSDINDLSMFFVVKLTNPTTTQNKYAFAPEWIADGSWTSLDVAATVVIEVLDTNTDHTLIISALASQGYPNASITSVTSAS